MPLPSTVLVTGASGFIGRHLVDALAARDVDVIALSRATPPAGAPGTWVVSDLGASVPPADLGKTVGAIVHLATPIDREAGLAEAVRVNVDAIARLFDWAEDQKVRHFVQVSSSSVYALDDDVSAVHDEEATLVDAPAPPYALTKKWGEALARSHRRVEVEHVTVLRPAQVYGAGQRESATIAQLAETVTAGGQVYLPGKDGHALSPVHVDDVVDAIVWTLENPTNATWNVGGPEIISEAQIARQMAEHFDTVLAFVDLADQPTYSFAVDSSKLEAAYPEWSRTGLNDGLQRTWPDGDYD